MEIRRIQWQETIALRHAVLWPNKDPKFCYVEGDESAWHFGAFLQEDMVSVASIYPECSSARLRKFATSPEYQKKGIGSKMIIHILSELRAKNIEQLWCDARESAMGFYERFGMKPDCDRFYKGDVPYFRMSVQIK